MHFHALSDRSISHFSRINSEIRNSKLSFRWHELFYYSTRIVPFHFHLFIYLLIFQYFLIALRNENNQNPKRSFRSHNRHYFYTNRMEIVDEKGGEKKKKKWKNHFEGLDWSPNVELGLFDFRSKRYKGIWTFQFISGSYRSV